MSKAHERSKIMQLLWRNEFIGKHKWLKFATMDGKNNMVTRLVIFLFIMLAHNNMLLLFLTIICGGWVHNITCKNGLSACVSTNASFATKIKKKKEFVNNECSIARI